jgi:hypothetical protein
MAQLLKSGPVQAELKRRADKVAAAAKADPHDETGDYEASIQVVPEIHPTRAVAHVTATVPYAMQVEAAHGVLARALSAAR